MVILNFLNNIQTLIRQCLIKLYCLSLSRFKIPNSAKAHEDCRRTVCIICMKKADRELAGTQMAKIQQVIQKHINFKEHRQHNTFFFFFLWQLVITVKFNLESWKKDKQKLYLSFSTFNPF